MEKITDGYYFMFEIGWFLDLLSPTLVRVKDDKLYLVGSKPCEHKDMKPCCIPAGGTAECKALALDDPSLKAFKSTESLVLLSDPGALVAGTGIAPGQPGDPREVFHLQGKKAARGYHREADE